MPTPIRAENTRYRLSLSPRATRADCGGLAPGCRLPPGQRPRTAARARRVGGFSPPEHPSRPRRSPTGPAGADGRRQRARPCGSRTPVLAAGVDVAPAAAAELVPGARTEASRRSGTGEAATDRSVEPDVLPTAGVRLADRTRTFTPPAPGDLSTPSKSRGHASPKTTHPQAYPAGRQVLHGVDQVGEVAAEAVELPDDEHVALPQGPQAAV